MKKLFTILLSVFILSQNVNASIENEVFKIISYKKSDIWSSFSEYALWSSVLLKDNTLVTNAHVILDTEEKPTWYYIWCKTDSFEETPDCKYVLKLKKYDKENDIATLEILDKDILWNTVFSTWNISMWTWKINLWDDVNIYGYPWIWWETITYSKWKISWFEEWNYKTDTTIDQWNSWGWAFDKDWKYIWIPSALTSSFSTIWWIIPWKKVKTFMDESWSWTLFENKNLDLDNFKKHLVEEYEYKKETQKSIELWDNFKLENILSDYKYRKIQKLDNAKSLMIISKTNKKYWSIVGNTKIKNISWMDKKTLMQLMRDDLKKYWYSKCSKPAWTSIICIDDYTVILVMIKWNDVITIISLSEESKPEKKILIENLKTTMKAMRLKDAALNIESNSNIDFWDITLKNTAYFFQMYSIQWEKEYIDIIAKDKPAYPYTLTLSYTKEEEFDTLEKIKEKNESYSQLDKEREESWSWTYKLDNYRPEYSIIKNKNWDKILITEYKWWWMISAKYLIKWILYSFDMQVKDAYAYTDETADKAYRFAKKIFTDYIIKWTFVRK